MTKVAGVYKIGYAYSNDGISWTEYGAVKDNSVYEIVLYDSNAFGIPGGSYYKMWYQNAASTNNIYYAESNDGITWTGDVEVLHYPGTLLNDCYGPDGVLYNPTATNTGSDPMNYKFVMYVTCFYSPFATLLYYSPDGINWTVYVSGNPNNDIFPWRTTNQTGIAFPTRFWVVKMDDGRYISFYDYFWPGSKREIRYAISPDGKTGWTDIDVIFSVFDNVPWRAGRTYQACVLHDDSWSDKWRMWFSGVNAPETVYAIGYATTNKPDPDYDTIQEAIDEASPGDTIIVHAGIYDEQVVIGKSLTLQGCGETTIVRPSSAAKLTKVFDGLFWYGTPNTKKIAGIIVANVPDGSNVTIKNLKVDESSVATMPAGADYLAGIFYRETGGTIDTINIVGTGAWSPGRAYGIYLSAATNTVSVQITGSTITNYDKNGIEAMGNKLSVNVHHNTITGRGSIGDEVQNGVDVGRDAVGTVNYNTISNLVYQPEISWAAAIMFYHYVSPQGVSASAQGNTITDCQIGIIFKNVNAWAQNNTVAGGTVGLVGIYAEPNYAGAYTASFVNNTVSGVRDTGSYQNAAIGANTYATLTPGTGASLTVTIRNNQLTGGSPYTADGVYVDGTAGSVTATISDNIISGWNHGINLASACVAGATITGNTITNNLGTDSGIHIEPTVTVTNVHVNYNNIFGNNETGTYGISNNGIGTLDARHNWWGHPTGPYHPELNPSAKGDKVSDNVNFEPWLVKPYPPATPVKTLLYIDPAKIEFWTPSYDIVFEVELKIADVTNLTCYEFKLYWNTTLLDFDYAHIIEIWPLQIKWEEIDESLGRYWLGVSARGEDKFTGNATLVELCFKIKYDPIYPNNVYSLLNLNETVLGDASEPTPQPIPHMVHDGEYWCYSTKPKMKVEPSLSTAKKLGKTFSVNITVHDVVRMYDFEFWLYYDTTLLDIYSPYIQLGPMMSGATIYISGYDDVLGYVHFAAKLTSPAPPVNGSGTIAIITFKVTKASIWPDPDLQCALDITNTKLKAMGGLEVPHDETDGLYRYRPVIGDLTCDGTVDLDDIYIISLAYGSIPEDPNWNRIADLNGDNVVNVLDLRTAARHYGEDC